jgi:hypothetical protein
MPGAQGRRDDRLGQFPAQDLGPAVAERPLGGRVELDDPPPVVDGDDAVQGGLEDGRLARFALAHRLLGLLAPDELPDLAADGGHHRQQLVVRLLQRAVEELDHAEHLAAAPDREAEGAVQADPGRGRGPGEVGVRQHVRDPGGRAAGPDPAGQPDPGPEAGPPAHVREGGQLQPRRMPQVHAAEQPGRPVHAPQTAQRPAQALAGGPE